MFDLLFSKKIIQLALPFNDICTSAKASLRRLPSWCDFGVWAEFKGWDLWYMLDKAWAACCFNTCCATSSRVRKFMLHWGHGWPLPDLWEAWTCFFKLIFWANLYGQKM